MYKLLITINNPSKESLVQQYVKKTCPHWCHYIKCTWFIESDKDHNAWTDLIHALIGENNEFIVMDVSSIDESKINGRLTYWSYFKERFPSSKPK